MNQLLSTNNEHILNELHKLHTQIVQKQELPPIENLLNVFDNVPDQTTKLFMSKHPKSYMYIENLSQFDKLLHQIIIHISKNGVENTREELYKMGWMFRGISIRLYEIIYLSILYKYFGRDPNVRLFHIYNNAYYGHPKSQAVLTIPGCINWDDWHFVFYNRCRIPHIIPFVYMEIYKMAYEQYDTPITLENINQAHNLITKIVESNDSIFEVKSSQMHSLLIILIKYKIMNVVLTGGPNSEFNWNLYIRDYTQDFWIPFVHMWDPSLDCKCTIVFDNKKGLNNALCLDIFN